MFYVRVDREKRIEEAKGKQETAERREKSRKVSLEWILKVIRLLSVEFQYL